VALPICPPVTQVDLLPKPVVRIGETRLVDDDAGIHQSVGNSGHDLVIGQLDALGDLGIVQTEKEIGCRETPGYGDAAVAERYVPPGASDDEGSTATAECAATSEQHVLVEEVGQNAEGHLGDVEAAGEGETVERLDVLEARPKGQTVRVHHAVHER